MRVRLVLSQLPLFLLQRTLALAGSALLHGVGLTALLTYSGIPKPDSVRVQFPAYHVRILRLAPLYLPRPALAALHKNPAMLVRTQAAREVGSAPQTLLVEGAPRLQLAAPIPLPAIFSRGLPRPLPSFSERIRADGPDAVQHLSADIALEPPAPTPVRMISIPDRVLTAAAASALPAVNQLARTAGESQPSGTQANPTADRTPSPQSSSQAAQPEQAAAGTPAPGAPPSPADKESTRTEIAPDGPTPAGTATRKAQPSATDKGLMRIELPPNGYASVVMFGDSVATQYPETAEQLRGVAVSTTYLSVGLSKNWILEYWASPQQGSALNRGTTAQLNAPWPYVMFRPEVMLPSDSPIMIRGVLSAAGRLERLTLLLPAELPQKGLLLQALSQWRFRAASRNGQPQAMEILLVIPQQEQQ